MKGKENSLVEGNVARALLRFTVPILLALMLQAAYSAVDLLIVGNFGDTSCIPAVGTGGAVMTAITTIVTSLSTGVTVLVGQRVGRQDEKGISRAIGAALVLFGLISVTLTFVMLFATERIVALMKVPAEAQENAMQYLWICSAGIIFIIAYNVICGVVRGIGNSKMPLLFVAVACIVNILGDLLLIGVFGLDAAGAALATVAAQAFSVVLSLFLIRKQGKEFHIHIHMRDIRMWKEETAEILKIGIPLALQSALAKISFLVINALINHMGLYEAAGYSIAEKLTSFIMLVPTALSNSISAFVAQNVGAENPKRAREALWKGMAMGGGLGVLLFLMGFFGSGMLAGFFDQDAEVIHQAAIYMKGFSADCILGCVHFSLIGYFNGNGRSIPVMIQGITAAFLVRIPFSVIMLRKTGSLLFIGMATPVSTVYGILFFSICLWNFQRQQSKG